MTPHSPIQPPPPRPDPELAREQLTDELDGLLARISDLLGPTAMAALVAGRVARAARLQLRGDPT